MKLIETKIVKGSILVESGMHIGGSKNSLDIGGLDSPVIKTPKGVPYIPGSSLKGKLRSLLALREGVTDLAKEPEWLKKMFGTPGDSKGVGAQLARVVIRDAYLDEEKFKKDFEGAVLETEFTESKMENTIDRATGKTKNGGLRQIERVPMGASFNFEIVVTAYDDDNMDDMIDKLNTAISMLENNYIGGSGTRGYGKVKFITDEDKDGKA